MEEGGGRGQCYLKRKKGRTQNNKRGEKKVRMRKLQKKIPNPNYKVPEKNLS